MSTQEPNYPKEYRGNQIHDETKVRNLQPSERPRLNLVTNPREIDHILERIGVEHDRESIVRQDSYNCLWVDVKNAECAEVWGIHNSVPHLDRYAVRLK